MITFEEAQNIIFSCAEKTGIEKVRLGQSIGRILADDIKADADMPPFNRSAMDGYACRKEDVDKPLEIIEEIPAGKEPLKNITTGQCSSIMTGAPVPEGSNWVVRVEHTAVNQNGYVMINDPGNSSNIRYQGEDIKKDQIVINQGTCIRSQHAGLMAIVGVTEPEVYKIPDVGIISTGSELVTPDKKPGKSQIRNSNGPQLLAQLSNMGIAATDYGIVTDHPTSIKESIQNAINENEVVLISGGVSAGVYDYVPSILKELGFNILMHKMKVRPGKPLLFAVSEGRSVFGIPGNPVSTLVQFEIMIKPFLLKKMGSLNWENNLRMVMGHDFENDASSLRYFVPVKFSPEGVLPLPYHGSGHLSSYSEADGILMVPEGTGSVHKGEPVSVLLL